MTAFLCCLVVSAPRAQGGATLTDLYSFNANNSSLPLGGLTQGADGNLYGTTEEGGASGFGTVFKITPGGLFTQLHSFAGNQGAQDGFHPQAPLVLGSDGELYGTTSPTEGWNSSVFKITTNGVLTTYYPPYFTPGYDNGTVSGLVQGVDGNIYGTTSSGAPDDFGAIFSMTTNGVFTLVYSFKGGTEGVGGDVLVAARDGNIYGITGVFGFGLYVPTNQTTTVFKITYDGQFTPLNSFTNTGIDGGNTLVAGSDGNLYGTSYYGGTAGHGTVFRITTNGAFTTLYAFTNFFGGYFPVALTQGRDGNLYGTTQQGGPNGVGTVFEVTTNGDWTFLGGFVEGSGNGVLPFPAQLAQASDGSFYGTTTLDGIYTNGSVFRLSVSPEPSIAAIQPTNNQTLHAGTVFAGVIFTVYANGVSPLNYQWLKEGSPLSNVGEISGATNSTLALNGIFNSDAGTYMVVISNNFGSVTSAPCMLTVIADTNPPNIYITSPISDIRSSAPVLGVETFGASGVAGLDFWITNLNGFPTIMGSIQLPVVPGTFTENNEVLTNALFPGTNIIAAQSWGYSSNYSSLASQSFFYKVPSRLTVTSEGDGNGTFTGTSSIHGDTAPSNKALLNIGEGYAITAKPDKNSWFSSWSGSIISTNPTLRFIMESNLLLQANFTTNLFLAEQGVYNGLFAPVDTPRSQSDSGAFTLKVTSTGVLSGTLQLGTDKVTLTGKFNESGEAQISSTRKGQRTLTTTLQLDLADRSVQGTVSDGSFVSVLNGDRAVFSPTHKAANYEGQYTLIIPGANDPTTGPFGASYGTVIVSTSGNVTFAGSLADGTAVNQSSVVSKDGFWPFYLAPYGTNGSLWSWNQFTNGSIISSTNASWINATNSTKTALYRVGFTNQAMSLIGSAYNPTDKPLLALTSGQVTLDGGNLPFAIDNLINLSSNNAITLAKTVENTNKLSLAITKSSGLISGSFANPSNPKQTIKVHGVLLQNQTNAAGYFLGTDESGSFLLAPQ